jgi:ribosomal-protein-serine acetyltransferase
VCSPMYTQTGAYAIVQISSLGICWYLQRMTSPILLELPSELRSPRLSLQMPQTGRGGLIAQAINASLPELQAYMSFAQKPTTPEECELELRRDLAAFILRERLMFQIFTLEQGLFVGEIGFRRLNWQTPKFEVSYWADSRQAGQGYMTEAVQTLTQFAFEHFSARRVELHCDVRNLASRRVAEKAGFVLEGILKNDMTRDDGSSADGCVFARVSG